MLWNVGEAARRDEIINDLLDKSFGPAREPMAQWYRLIDGSNKPLTSKDLVGLTYRQLQAPLNLAKDEAIRARIYDLVMDTCYVELYLQEEEGKGREAPQLMSWSTPRLLPTPRWFTMFRTRAGEPKSSAIPAFPP